jgi:hypothetical protein
MNQNLKLQIITSAIAVAALFFTQSVFAQDEPAGLSFTGSIDTYFRTNLNAPNTLDSDADGTDDVVQAPFSSFANLPGFSLGMANLIASYDGEKAGFVADLVLGPRGSDAVFASPMYSSTGQIVNQLYAYWIVNETVTLTLGNFNTFLGYEVISPTNNFNYSTSYMFSYGPFSHSGLKADFTFGDLSLMTAVMNSTDITEFNPDGHYYGGVQLGYGGAYLNFLFDDEFFQVDLTAGWDLTDTFYLGVNATSASDNFFGGALYLQNSFTDAFALGLRGEYFSDQGLGILTMDETVIDVTLSANYSIGNLKFIPEIRLDSFSQDDVFIADPDDFTKTTSSLSSFALAAVYAF